MEEIVNRKEVAEPSGSAIPTGASGPTFGDLKKEAARNGKSTTHASSVSALNSYMFANDLCDRDPIAGWIDVPDDAFKDRLKQCGDRTTVGVETIGAYQSRLRGWNILARGMRIRITPAETARALLVIAVSSYLERTPKSSKAKIEEAAGLSRGKLSNLLNPNDVAPYKTEKAVKQMHRLENLLGLEQGQILPILLDMDRAPTTRRKKIRKIKGVTLRGIRMNPVIPPKAVAHFMDRLTVHKSPSRIGSSTCQPS